MKEFKKNYNVKQEIFEIKSASELRKGSRLCQTLTYSLKEADDGAELKALNKSCLVHRFSLPSSLNKPTYLMSFRFQLKTLLIR